VSAPLEGADLECVKWPSGAALVLFYAHVH